MRCFHYPLSPACRSFHCSVVPSPHPPRECFFLTVTAAKTTNKIKKKCYPCMAAMKHCKKEVAGEKKEVKLERVVWIATSETNTNHLLGPPNPQVTLRTFSCMSTLSLFRSAVSGVGSQLLSMLSALQISSYPGTHTRMSNACYFHVSRDTDKNKKGTPCSSAPSN